MTDFASLFSWSRPRVEKSLPPTPSNTASRRSSPIPIPRRRSVHPPPCSPTRSQDSPELVFNFDFSLSPDAPDATAHVLFQQRGANMRRLPLQKAAYSPLATLGTNHQRLAHPYAQEPFLYPVPKPPPATEKALSKVGYADKSLHALKEQIAPDPPARSTYSSPSASSLSSSRSSRPSCLPSANASSLHLDTDEAFPLTSAFERPLMSDSVASSYNSMSSFQDIESLSLSPPTPYRTPSPSPPRLLPSDARLRQATPQRPAALQRTQTAAPVVSLNVTQAQRSDRSSGIGRGERSRSPSSGIVPPRTRRSSSVGAGLDLTKLRDPTRRMGTVVGRGAGRVISMFEYGNVNARSLVSDEDIEGSLEKDHADRPRDPERDRRLAVEREKDGVQGCGSPVLERGRARGRAGVAAPKRTRALPGWQWMDAR
ncbi:hypothetical protein BD309DRAFT_645865 [Dichomitus squalens]|uniref:Uncharacterized protein n=1 Tax=Dichomitus squalens TaxID=114155 RepID=A0A4Q9PSL4_9APHY|nr:hypothetical protein BD309DRAFT_645865 [Dichomitus squalens]TBU57355.1 hypothetical protein BD310DRAFT_556649 [Dichomitus squalens]